MRLRTDAYDERHERLGSHEVSAALTTLKQHPQTTGLHEGSSVPLQPALRHLAKALHTCFEGRATSSPCQQRRGRQAATSASSVCHWDAQTRAPLPLQWSGSFTGTPATLRGSLDPAERALVSFLVEADIQALPVVKALVGVEVGLKDRAVFSSGEQVATPKHLRRGERRLAHAQRTLARNQNGAKHRDETWHE